MNPRENKLRSHVAPGFTRQWSKGSSPSPPTDKTSGNCAAWGGCRTFAHPSKTATFVATDQKEKSNYVTVLPTGLYGRFWSNVTVGEPNACWPWTGRVSRDGYGRIKGLGQSWVASRLSWTIHFGDVPAGLVVCHRCDNPPCVNPAHLFLGTHKDNAQDSVRKGRHGHPWTESQRAALERRRAERRAADLAYQLSVAGAPR